MQASTTPTTPAPAPSGAKDGWRKLPLPDAWAFNVPKDLASPNPAVGSIDITSPATAPNLNTVSPGRIQPAGFSVMVSGQDAMGAVPRRRGDFMSKHNAHVQRAREGNIDLLFLGDSFAENWGKFPEVRDAAFGQHRAAFFGISIDQTQHLLWRIDDGELTGITPRVVVLSIGAYNLANTAEQIASGIYANIDVIVKRLPQTKVIVLGPLPCDPERNVDPRRAEARRELLRKTNTRIATLDNGDNLICLRPATSVWRRRWRR